MEKLYFTGKITSIQPRIRLTRSFDEVSHTYLGYVIRINGLIESGQPQNSKQKELTDFTIGIGKATHAKFQFRVNNTISGRCAPVSDARKEPVDYYKVSALKIISAGNEGNFAAPWETIPPELEVYRERGHRRLATRTYNSKCSSCIWACRMPVEIIVDHWDPKGKRKYRFETFCYGPLDCRIYKPGANRTVEGRKGMVYVEEDWVDEMNVEHRKESS